MCVGSTLHMCLFVWRPATWQPITAVGPPGDDGCRPAHHAKGHCTATQWGPHPPQCPHQHKLKCRLLPSPHKADGLAAAGAHCDTPPRHNTLSAAQMRHCRRHPKHFTHIHTVWSSAAMEQSSHPHTRHNKSDSLLARHQSPWPYHSCHPRSPEQATATANQPSVTDDGRLCRPHQLRRMTSSQGVLGQGG